MSEKQQTEKETPAPKDSGTAPQGYKRGTSKSYGELLLGFEEIRKIQTNQDVFEKRKTAFSFENVEKAIDEQENPDV